MDVASIFKAYDIRGIYGETLTEEVAYKTARAFAQLLKSENEGKKLRVALGVDMRTSTPSLKEEVIRGLTDEAVDVADMGLVSTPAFYFAVAQYEDDGGIMVTASHNPGEYNGLKFVRAGVKPVSADSGIHDMRDAVINNTLGDELPGGGVVTERHGVIEEHVEFAVKHSGTKMRPFKVVADAANSMGATYLKEMFKHLPNCELIELNFELDGTFPAHEADPFKDENNEQLVAAVKEHNADLGIATDGDGDRIFFIDNEGVMIDPAIVRGLMAKIMLEEHPGAVIGYDIRPGRITRDMIEENGGVATVTKVGHSFIKAQAIEKGAVFAGESSGHFFVKTELGVFETPVIVALKMMQFFSRSEDSVADQVRPLRRYSHSGEINSEVEDKEGVMNKLKEVFGPDAKDVSELDGVTIEYENFWFNVRPSNTEPKLRLNLEAVDDATMQEKRDEVLAIIRR